MRKYAVSNSQLVKIIRVVNIVLLFIIAVGFVIFTFLGVRVYLNSTIPRGYSTTKGRILRTETLYPISRGSKSLAIIGFDIGGNTYEFKNPIARPTTDYPYDQQINVAYDPADPGSSPVNVDELPTLRKTALPNIAFGLFLMTISAYFIYAIRRGVKKYKIY